jgi:hypothetical protein
LESLAENSLKAVIYGRINSSTEFQLLDSTYFAERIAILPNRSFISLG